MPRVYDHGHATPRRRVPEPRGDTKSAADLGRGRAESNRNIRTARQRIVTRRSQVRDVKSASDFARGRAESARNIRSARIQHLRATRLHGQAWLSHLADQLAQAAYVPNTGGGPNLGGRGTPLSGHRGSGIATALAPRPVRYSDSPAGRALVHDLVNLGAAPFVAGASIAGAGVAGAHGDLGPAGRLAKETAVSTYDTFRHPVRSFEQHPFNTLLTFAGGASVGGRVGGAVARGATGGRIASTVRPPLALTDDAAGPVYERSYSKDLGRRLVQKRADAQRQPVRDARGRPATRMQRGREVPVLKATRLEQDHYLRTHADFEASRANARERHARELAAREMRVRGIRGRHAQDLVTLAATGALRTAGTFTEDLTKVRNLWRAEHARRLKQDPVNYRHSGDEEQARRNIEFLDRALADKRVLAQAPKIMAEGERIGRRLNEEDRKLLASGVLSDETRARRASLIHYAVQHMGARHVPNESGVIPGQMALVERGTATGDLPAEAESGALRHADGRVLPTSEIEAHLRAGGRDPGTVAYLPTQLHGARAFHSQFRPGTRPVMDKAGTRTGEAYRKGAVETSAQLLQQHGVKQATQLAKAQQLDRLVENSGTARPDGRLWTMKEAEGLAEAVEFDTRIGAPVFRQRNGQRLVPMRAFAARLSPGTQKIIRDDLQGPGAMESLHQQLLNDRIVHEGDRGSGARNVVLVPAVEVERLLKHLRSAPDLEKLLQAFNKPFRMAVLPQMRWLTGNFVEPYVVRLTASGSGLNVFGLGADLVAAQKAIRSLERSADPRARLAAGEIRAQQFGGLFVGGRPTVRRGFDDLPEAAQRAYGAMVAKLPATQQAVEVMGVTGHLLLAPLKVFFWANRHIESTAQRAAFGRQFRQDLHEFTGSWGQTIRLQQKAVDEAARGLIDTPTQHRFMRAQHELLGKYEGYSPLMRSIIQGPAPFLPWALNAARFVYWTMPVHHTALTALLTQVNSVVAKDWKDQHANVPPGGLKYALKSGRDGWVDWARYTPYGLTAPAVGGDIKALTNEFFPQFQGALAALGGKDPFGRDLKLDPRENAGVSKPNTVQNLGIAGYTFLESLVPYLSTARRLREGGGTAFAGSTVLDPDVKPGTKRMSAARRTFDPFRPTYLSAGAGTPQVLHHPEGTDPLDAALGDLHAQQDAGAAMDAAIDEALRRSGP